MLQGLGLVVDLPPIHAELTHQKRLQEAMTAHDAQGSPPSPPGQADPAVAHVLDKTVSGEPLHHFGDGGRRHREALGDLLVGTG